MSSTLTALTEATTFATTDEGYAVVSGNSRSFTFSTLGKLLGTGTLPFAAGTLTTSQPSTFTQTWNAAGVLFTGQKLEITNTASATGSRGFEIVMPSATNKYSLVVATSAGGTPLGFIRTDGTVAGVDVETTDELTAAISQSSDGVSLRSTSHIGFSNSTAWWNTQDLQLWRDATSVLAQRTSTAAQTFRLYRTFTDSSNYERLALQTGSGYVEVAAETAGTGTDDLDIRLTPVGVGNVKFYPGTATPAGGSTTARITHGSTAGFGIYIGSGVPTVSAAQGSLYLRSDGSSNVTRMYVNTNSSTTWTAVNTVA